ncbi:substrate-binding periplasmic protein [Shewanella gaetbuli]
MKKLAFSPTVTLCLVALYSIAFAPLTWATIPAKITLATTHWPPYTSSYQDDQPGIVYEYVTAILASHDIHLEVQRYPWLRAIKLAEEGHQIHGLLTAVQEEAPSLQFTQTPIMQYKVNFYTQSDAQWVYENADSLNNIPTPLSIILGYGYGSPVDEFINNPQNRSKLNILSGDDAQTRLLKMLQYQRAAVIIEDELVVNYYLNDTFKVRYAGTLSQSPFYLALNPNLPWANELITLLNKEFKSAENLLYLQSLVQKYSQKTVN